MADTLRWRNNGRDSVSNDQPHDCLLNRLFRRRSKKTSKLRATGLCAGNSPETCEFPTQMARNAENVSIWWRHHEFACHWGVQRTVNESFKDGKGIHWARVCSQSIFGLVNDTSEDSSQSHTSTKLRLCSSLKSSRLWLTFLPPGCPGSLVEWWQGHISSARGRSYWLPNQFCNLRALLPRILSCRVILQQWLSVKYYVHIWHMSLQMTLSLI